MHFGRNDIEFSNFDPNLPADAKMTTSILASATPAGVFEARVGAPKWGYKHWVGNVYQRGLRDTEFLKAYAKQFNTVELGATFYQIPSPEQAMAWKEMTSATPGFKFCPKFPQIITHMRRFRNVEEQTNKFYTAIAALGNCLGPVFLQLGDNFSAKGFNDLEGYLKTLPSDVPVYVEVRHKSWFNDGGLNENLFTTLQTLKIGAVISDTPGRRDCLHMTLTTPHAFIRFVTCGDQTMDFFRLDEWATRLKSWKEHGLQSLYFFIHGGDTPSLALYDYFISKLNRELGLAIQLPVETRS